MFIFLDTETTGTGNDDRLCQIAFKLGYGPAVCELFKPDKPISIDAMAIQHITNKMVEDKPQFIGSPSHKRTGNSPTIMLSGSYLPIPAWKQLGPRSGYDRIVRIIIYGVSLPRSLVIFWDEGVSSLK